MKILLTCILSLLLVFAVPLNAGPGYNTIFWRPPHGLGGGGAAYCLNANNVSVNGGFLNLASQYAPGNCPGNPPQYGPNTPDFTSAQLDLANFQINLPAIYASPGAVRIDVRAQWSAVGHGSAWLLGSQCQNQDFLMGTGFCAGDLSVNTSAGNQPELEIAETCPSSQANTIIRQNYSGIGSGGLVLFTANVTNYTTNFHEYSLIMNSTNIFWDVDRVQTNTNASFLPVTPVYLMLLNALGDTCSNPSTPHSNTPTNSALIDYVRICTAVSFTAAQNCTPGTSNMIFDDEFNGPTTYVAVNP